MEGRKRSIWKWVVVAAFLCVLATAGITAAFLNQKETTAGKKEFTVEIVSERDAYRGSTSYQSEEETLGDFLRTTDFVEYEDSSYGIYVKGFYDMEEDIDNQYWWCLSVNGEESTTGADGVPITEGDIYTFTLKQGFGF